MNRKLKFDDDILEVIKAVEWQEGGRVGILTCGQLDRQVYLRVNKALEALGGKWNRKLGGHVFKIDPRPQIDGLVETGALTIECDGFYETPPEIVRRMIELVEPVGRILEPSAGLGAIVDNLPVLKKQILCIEKDEYRTLALCKKGYVVHHGDFLEYSATEEFDRIFMNPPFENSQDIDHVRHAYSCLNSNGAMVSVMSEGPFFRNDNKATAFRDWLNMVGGKSYKLPPKSFHESGTDIHTRLVVIHKKQEEPGVPQTITEKTPTNPRGLFLSN